MLEAALQERALVLFRILLQYVTDLMVWEEGDELPVEMQPRSAKLDFFTTYLYFLVVEFRSFGKNFVYCSFKNE